MKLFELLDELNIVLKNDEEPKLQLIDELKNLTSGHGYVGMAQINLTAGNLKDNAKKIAKYIKISQEIGLDAVVFPKYSLLGSEMKDFRERYPFIVEENLKYLNKLAEHSGNVAAILGFVDSNGKDSFAILRNGRIENIIKDKEMITSKLIHDGMEFYIKPASKISRAGSEYKRQENLKRLAIESKRPILEVNQVGSIDNLSYAGISAAVDENGKYFGLAKDFEEQLFIVNPIYKEGRFYSEPAMSAPNEFTLDYEWDLERTYKTIVQSIKDYFAKCGLKRAVLGLSGGLDSTVCAVLLVDALGKENVFGVSMPSKLTSIESKSDARQLAENLGIGFAEVSIKPMFETTNSCFDELFSEVQKNWDCRYKESFTPDNIQARSRAMYLFGIANEFASCIPIATSDKSEAYMGYATINGDMSGGYAPLIDVTKTKLFALARWMNKNREQKNAIPESIILKRPGAELAIDPKTGKTLCAEDALMPYEFLDEIIWRIENWHESYEDLMKDEFIYEKKMNISQEQKKEWLDKFYRRMSSALYKSYIMPPSVLVDSQSVNKTDYSQPITSGKINYNQEKESEISLI